MISGLLHFPKLSVQGRRLSVGSSSQNRRLLTGSNSLGDSYNSRRRSARTVLASSGGNENGFGVLGSGLWGGIQFQFEFYKPDQKHPHR
jgi:hypothetical protein